MERVLVEPHPDGEIYQIDLSNAVIAASSWLFGTYCSSLYSVSLNLRESDMVKKVEVHLDTLVILALVMVVTFSFMWYQRYQYRILMHEDIECRWNESELEFEVARLQAKLEILAPEE